MAVEHSTLTTTDLHEPKGVAAAVADQIYIANGSASGVWTDADNSIYLFGWIDDISTAQSDFIVSPCTGTITKIQCILTVAITSADATVTFEIGDGTGSAGTLITDGGDNDLDVAYSGSGPGKVFTYTPTGARTLAIGSSLELITNGNSSTSCRANFTVTITPT
jgi:hypothetical protein